MGASSSRSARVSGDGRAAPERSGRVLIAQGVLEALDRRRDALEVVVQRVEVALARDLGQVAQVAALDRVGDGRVDRLAEVRQPAERPAAGPLARCLLYTSPSPRDKRQSRMPSSA